MIVHGSALAGVPLRLALSLLLVLLASACAAAGPQNASRPSANPSASPVPAEEQHVSGKKTGVAGDSAGTAANETVRRMLQSAGRNPDAAQPEAGFTLGAPASVGDGEAFLVSFAAQGARSMTLFWQGKTLAVSRASVADGSLQALLPVALDEKARNLPLAMAVQWENGRTESFRADLPVRKRRYPVQRLKVAQKFVTPPPELREKIKRDQAEMRAAVGNVSPQRFWSLPLLRPVPGEVTSLYGLRRVFNGQPRSPHRGVDFDAREGDPIAALDDGIVTLVAEHYYGGKTVVVDHGLGVVSVYLHLSAFAVTKGQRVSRGESVGRIGSTGRVTGPHLHLSLYVLGDSVNAATCINM